MGWSVFSSVYFVYGFGLDGRDTSVSPKSKSDHSFSLLLLGKSIDT